jgi:cell division septum initiation protein DivIVA
MSSNYFGDNYSGKILMSNDYRVIDADVRKFAAQFGGFLKAAEQLGQIASVEQAIVESQGRLHQARQEEADLEAARKEAKSFHESELDATHKRGIALYAQKADEAERLISDAHAQAALIVGSGHAKASEIVADAHKEASELRGSLDLVNADLVSARMNLVDEHKRLADVTAAKERAQADHERIRGMISELKAKL